MGLGKRFRQLSGGLTFQLLCVIHLQEVNVRIETTFWRTCFSPKSDLASAVSR